MSEAVIITLIICTSLTIMEVVYILKGGKENGKERSKRK